MYLVLLIKGDTMGTIERKPALIKNAIPNQTKTSNSLLIHEWNTFINQLRTQTNLNTEYLEKLHYVLFGPLDPSKPPLVEVTDLSTLTADINTHAQTIAEINTHIKNLILGKWHSGTLLETIDENIEIDITLFSDRVLIDDLYLNTANGNIYKCINVTDEYSYWTYLLNIKGLMFSQDEESTEIEYTLMDCEDKTFLSDAIESLKIIIPEDIYHGFCCGINFKSGETPPTVTFENNASYPFKIIMYGTSIPNYEPKPNRTVTMSIFCDGINLYCYINEVDV